METVSGIQTYEFDKTKGALDTSENKVTVFDKGKGLDAPKEDA